MSCLSCNKELVLKAEENAWYKCERCGYPLVCDRCNGMSNTIFLPEEVVRLIRQHKIIEHYTSVELCD